MSWWVWLLIGAVAGIAIGVLAFAFWLLDALRRW